MKAIIGLGNPEKKYAYTRHNLGFMVVESIAEEFKAKFRASFMLKAAITTIITKNQSRVVLAKPTTYMNLSGTSVLKIMRRFSLSLDDLLLICDDADLPLGKIRIRAKGSAAGHNGMLSVIESLKSSNFCRLRIGIGRNPDLDLADFVLSEFNTEEKQEINQAIERAKSASLEWVLKDCNYVMNLFN